MVSPNALILRFEDMGDVNKDGHPDFIIGYSGTKAVIINGSDASILWQKQLSDKSWNVTNMGDITWDGTNDAAVGTLYQDNRTYFLDGTDGTELFSAMSNTPIDALDAIPDIVGDNSMELVAGGRNGLVVCLSGGYDSTLTSLPGDLIQKTGLARIYPNPCKDMFRVEIFLDRDADITLELLDMRGRKIFSRIEPNPGAGRHFFYIRASQAVTGSLQDGLYILRVKTSEGVQHLKVMVHQ
jgi:hypothetical protein